MDIFKTLVICAFAIFVDLNGANSDSVDICADKYCYYFYDIATSWEGAEKTCGNMRAELAPFTDELNNLIKSNVGRLKSTSYWVDQEDRYFWSWRDTRDGSSDIAIDLDESFDDDRGKEQTQCGVLNKRGSIWHLAPQQCSKRWGAVCQVDFSANCKLSEYGKEFRGTVSRTFSNFPCAYWDDAPRESLDRWSFPEGNPSSAFNYCRNPNNDTLYGPWCRLSSSDHLSSFEYCNIESCIQEDGCYSQKQINMKTLRCTENSCYVFFHPNDGAKSWRESVDCCKKLKGGKLASMNIDSVTAIVNSYASPDDALPWLNGQFWVALSNRPFYNKDGSDICPYAIKTTLTDGTSAYKAGVKDCDMHNQGFICRHEINRPTTPTPRPTPVPTSTTTTVKTTPSTTTTTATATTTQVQTTTTSTAASTTILAVAVTGLLSGNNIIYLTVVLAAAILIIAIIIAIVIIYFRKKKNSSKPARRHAILARENSGTQTIIDNDYNDIENVNGAVGGVAAKKPLTRIARSHSTSKSVLSKSSKSSNNSNDSAIVTIVPEYATSKKEKHRARNVDKEKSKSRPRKVSTSSQTNEEEIQNTDNDTHYHKIKEAASTSTADVQYDNIKPLKTPNQYDSIPAGVRPLPLPPKQKVYNVVYDKPKKKKTIKSEEATSKDKVEHENKDS